MSTPKTDTERVNKLRENAKSKGWKRREYYASPAEHTILRDKLKEIRDVNT